MSAYTCTSRNQSGFPKKLLELDPWPSELHCHGPWQDLGKAVSIVGSRAASREGMQRAYDLALGLAQSGIRVLSGGALGIDGAAHRGALAGGGYTAAIMAGGLDSYYPQRHASLFAAILKSGGAMLSPFENGYPPLPANFVRRNSLIAVLADAVVVVEASTRSGSLHTARFATRYGRRLLCFQGSPGCTSLVARGVQPVSGVADVLTLLDGGCIERHVPLPEISDDSRSVLSALSVEHARDIADIASGLPLSLRQVQRLALELSLQSLAIALPGLRYKLSPLGDRLLLPI